MSLAQLPDELLISVFERLSLKERHRSLPLVSRRCWQLLRTPQLLHTVKVSISGDEETAMGRLRSLAHFVMRRGAGSVRRLQLDLGECGEAEHNAAECQVLAACAATACSGLQELGIECRPTVTLSTWLLPLASSLRRLSTGVFTSTVVAGPLQFLIALQELELGLASESVRLEADACLPASITRLALGNGYDGNVERMPPQVGTLHHLRHLLLRNPCADAASYDALTRLSLHTLELVGVVRALPSCLSALTSLEVLAIDASETEDEQGAVATGVVAGALPQLTRLTRLELDLWWPDALASLTALHRLRWLCWSREPLGPPAALPPGGWMQQLQTLAAPQSLVARSLPALSSSAFSLEQLCPYAHHGSTDAQLRAIISWAVQHPGLQQLLLGYRSLSSTMWGEVTAAIRLRPSLRIVPGTLGSLGSLAEFVL